MKSGMAILLLGSALLSVNLVFGIPTLARSSSSASATNSLPRMSSARAPEITTNTSTSIEQSAESWQGSTSEALHKAALAAEDAYNRAARDVENLSLRGRVEAVLHENKSTRDSDVHVTADNGTVTLYGAVRSERNAQNVEQVVANVYGVKAVNNKLTYPAHREVVTPRDAASTGVVHPAYSDIAPAERAPVH